MISEIEPPPTKKTTPSSQSPPSFSTLPEEITEICLARVSKWYYPKLSLVSRTFRSLLSSPQLYAIRSQIGTVETCLYMCLEFYNNQQPSWFFLQKKSVREENEISYQYSLVPLPSSSQSPPIPYNSTLAIGSKIYLIGGTEEAPSFAVRVLDCRTHTWHNAPNMTVAREEALAVLIDENIYVIGGCKENESVNWMEVFNIKTQTWKSLTTTGGDELRKEPHFTIKVLEGKIYAMGANNYYFFDPKEGKWSIVKEHMDTNWIIAWCVVDNVIYCYSYVGYCLWYDWEIREWKEVKGLDFALLREDTMYGFGPRSTMRMVNNGGKLVLVWDSTFELFSSFQKGQFGVERLCWRSVKERDCSNSSNVQTPLEQPNCVLGCLEMVKFDGYKGREVEKEMVMYLLENGSFLEKIAIKPFFPISLEEIQKTLMEFSSKPWSSSKCKLYFEI